MLLKFTSYIDTKSLPGTDTVNYVCMNHQKQCFLSLLTLIYKLCTMQCALLPLPPSHIQFFFQMEPILNYVLENRQTQRLLKYTHRCSIVQ